MTADNTNGRCLGEPEDFQGGDLRFCDAPIIGRRRFCDRCQAIQVKAKRARVLSLLAQYTREMEELSSLVREGGEP